MAGGTPSKRVLYQQERLEPVCQKKVQFRFDSQPCAPGDMGHSCYHYRIRAVQDIPQGDSGMKRKDHDSLSHPACTYATGGAIAWQ